RLVIACYEQLELREKVKEVLPHEARGKDIATGKLLDLRFIPTATALSFYGGHKPRAPPSRHVGGVTGRMGRPRRPRGQFPVVVSEDPRDGSEEDRLAVFAGTVGEAELLFDRRSG